VTSIRIEGLNAGYDRSPVLVDADLEVPSGSLTCVLGASGCGKTTLLRVIAGFTPADSGTVRIGDVTVDDGRTRMPPERRRVGYVAQEGALFPHLSVEDNVGFSLHRRTRASRTNRRAAIDRMLELVGMTGFGERLPYQLSGGQQQRVAIARALAGEPQVVLLDEPFASLDANLRARMREEIREILVETGVTTILVTHDRNEALSLADQVAVIHAHHVHQVGTPSDIYRRPTDIDVALATGAANVLDAQVQDGRAATRLGVLDLQPGHPTVQGALQVLVRPEHVRLERLPTTTAEPSAIGSVIRVQYFGEHARVEVRVRDSDPELVITSRVSGDEMPDEGDQVAVRISGPVWLLEPGSEGITPPIPARPPTTARPADPGRR
jgi:iron(III) transport system ATP-binding protein